MYICVYIYASFHIVTKRINENGNSFSYTLKASFLTLKYVFVFNQVFLFYL